MGLVLAWTGLRALVRSRPVDRVTGSSLLLAGLAAFAWKAPLFAGYSEDDYSLVELQETVFFVFLTLALFLWSSGLLARHARMLRAANDSLLASNRARERLVHTISHDLAGPLSPIKIQMTLLARNPDDPAAVRERAETVGRNVERMERLIGDLRDVALLDAGQLAIAPNAIDLAAVLRDAAATLRPKLEGNGIRLETSWPEPLPATADPQRVGQVLLNLLGNAGKFTPSGGTVRLEARTDGDRVVVAVADTGRGLEPDEAARLFQPFSQVHGDGESRERGTGLGLYICRSLVEAHGGRIRVESRGRGQGSTFTFDLPGPEADVQARAAPAALPAQPNP